MSVHFHIQPVDQDFDPEKAIHNGVLLELVLDPTERREIAVRLAHNLWRHFRKEAIAEGWALQELKGFRRAFVSLEGFEWESLPHEGSELMAELWGDLEDLGMLVALA